MQKTCMLLIYGTNNLLAAISAVCWINRGLDYRVITIVYCPQKSMENSSIKVVNQIISSLGWDYPLTFDDQEIMKSISDCSLEYTIKKFKDAIGIYHLDEIYYCHNFVGNMTDFGLNAYPEAERIIIGDGLGQVYDRKYLSLIPGTWPVSINHLYTLLLRFKQLLNHTIPRATLQNFSPDKAVLILPMDYSGDLLAKIPLEVIPRDAVIGYIDDITSRLPELSKYIGNLVRQIKGRGFILILTNFSDGGFITLDAEAEMFEQMVRKNAAPGDTILLKAHPLSCAGLDNAIVRRLQDDYHVMTICGEFDRYPFELCKELVKNYEVISISSVVISLKYIYDKDAIYGWDESTIKRFFPRKFWRYLMESDVIYQKQLLALKTWDGKSVLCKIRVPI